MSLLKDKNGLIMGVANERSIAWGIAKEAAFHGANLAFTYQNDTFFERLKPLAKSINSSLLIKCDVSNNSDIAFVFKTLNSKWNKLDFIVHAMAFSDKNELKNKYFKTSKENFRNTLLISTFSLTEICKQALPIMKQSGGGSILTLTYIGGNRTTPNYNVMGVAKAALETSVKYLAMDLGNYKIRVNSLSSGPMRTLAGAAISGARHVFRFSEKNSPLGKNPELEEVGKAGVYLVSDLSSGVTGENHFVDCGYNIIAIPRE